MKNLTKFINEQQGGSSFKQEVSYSAADWNKWKNETRGKDIYVGTVNDEPDLELVYIPNHKSKTLDHIATYNIKTHVLFCDDINLFGHEVKK